MNDDIRKIVDAAVHAPSGDNCQPWRFEIAGDTIMQYNLSNRDVSLYSWGQRASYVSHGAAVENMRQLAGAMGYDLRIRLFPGGADPDLVAEVKVVKSAAPVSGNLAQWIEKRVTNRKRYKPKPVQLEEKSQLTAQVTDGATLALVDDPVQVSELAGVASMNEKLLFENEAMHNFFYAHINWNETEDRERSIGFYVKTLEIPSGGEGGFKMAKSWPLLRLLNMLGFSKFIASNNRKTYASAPLYGVLLSGDTSPEGYFKAGQSFQRVWLKATSLGLYMQPLTGILFLKLRLDSEPGTGKLSESQAKAVHDSYAKVVSIANAGAKRAVMMFRIGYADPPSAQSSRLPLQVKIS